MGQAIDNFSESIGRKLMNGEMMVVNWYTQPPPGPVDPDNPTLADVLMPEPDTLIFELRLTEVVAADEANAERGEICDVDPS